MKLRGYQELQLDFLKKNNGLVKGLQSPTGTGKSIVLLSYIKECLDSKKYNTIVLSTGFNELVFQMSKDAKELGLDPKVIIGSGHLIPNCEKQDIAPDFSFSTTPINKCSICDPEGEKRKRYQNICSKKCIMNYIGNFSKPKVIITNHSYLLVMKDYLKADLIIIDEAHTFGEFYMSNNTVSFTEKEKELLENYCSDIKTPTSQIFKLSLNRGIGLNSTLLNNVVNEIEQYTSKNKFEIKEFARKLEAIFTAKAFDNYLECVNGNYIKTKFFSKYDLTSDGGNPDIVIVSATLDQYTLKMFDCTNKNQLYIQKEDRHRYSGSKFISCYKEYREYFEEVYTKISEENNIGLILCTSNDSVMWTIETINNKFKDVKVFKNSRDFRKYEGKKVLVGSKRFYQGVDIPDLEYVILDKLPFSVYDDKFKAYSYYIEKVTKQDAWKGYTMPLMYNSLLQGIGRLWRKNDIENGIYDQGTIVIFDERLKDKFNYIESKIQKTKPGIELIRLPLEVVEEKQKKEEAVKKKRRRNKIVVEYTNEDFDHFIKESIKESN